MAANLDSDNVTFLQGGPGGLSAAGAIKAGDGPEALASGDFDGDGFTEVVAANKRSGTITCIRGNPRGPVWGYETAAGSKLNPVPRGLATGDFDGDRQLDRAVANFGSNQVAFFKGGGGGLFLADELEAGDRPKAMEVADFNGDGYPALAVANFGSRNVTLFRGGQKGLARVGDFQAGMTPIALTSGDFDGDGFLDALVANNISNDVTYLRGDRGGFIPGGKISTGLGPTAMTCGDYNGDTFHDAVVANFNSRNLTFLRGDRKGLVTAGDLALEASPTDLLSGDFNGDGFLDVAAANQLSNTVTYLRGGPGGLQEAGEFTSGVGPGALTRGDYDGDGFLDVLAGNEFSHDLTYLRGGSGGLLRTGDIPAGDGPKVLTSADYDGDGFLDAVAVNFASKNLIYLRQRYLFPHANRFIDPNTAPGEIYHLADPRNPPRYLLDFTASAFSAPAQVCLLPGPVFELPQGEAYRRGHYLLAVTEAVRLLRETVELQAPGQLTLRLRDRDPALRELVLGQPSALRVLRKNSAAGTGEDAGLRLEDLRIIEIPMGIWISFPVLLFGEYVVAMELER